MQFTFCDVELNLLKVKLTFIEGCLSLGALEYNELYFKLFLNPFSGIANNPELRGVIPNAIEHIFQHIAQSPAYQQYLVRASYLEVYQEEIRDLLDSKDSHRRLELKERPDIGVYVKDLSSFVTKSVEEIEQTISVGQANRSVG